MQRISTLDDIAAALDALCGIDPQAAEVRAVAGEVPLRLSEPGFGSLVSIVVSQQVSRASADAIFGRLVRLADPLTPEALLAAGDGAVSRGRPVAAEAARRARSVRGSARTASTSRAFAISMPRPRSAR